MRNLTSIIVLAVTVILAGRSAAQPADPPGAPCTVAIVRAPDDVRLEIESWVARETSCRVALDVRVVPTEGGLYLLARESTGRIHERVVPDAQAAGVLVASWVADDRLEPVPAPPSPPAPSPPPPSPPPPSPPPPSPPPSMAPVVMRPLPVERSVAARPPSGGLYGALGVTVLPNDVSGARLRLALELMHRGGFATEMILAGAYSVHDGSNDFYYDYMRYTRFDGRALLGLSWTASNGPLRLRLGGAIGGVWSHVFHNEGVFVDDWFAVPFEASITLGYQVSDAWSIGFAPVATAYWSQRNDDGNAGLPGHDIGVLMELRRGR